MSEEVQMRQAVYLATLDAHTEIDKLKAELAEVKKENKVMSDKLNSIFVAGSDGCTKCETGRVTYWKKTMLCFDCERANDATKE